MQKSNPILQSIRNQPLAWMVQGVGVVFFVGNLFLASQLFPLIRQLDSLVSRVDAIEQIGSDQKENIKLIPVIRNDIQNMKDDLLEFKNDTKTIINQHIQLRQQLE